MTLLEAVESGDADAVVTAIEEAIDVNQQDGRNRTALIIAAQNGRADLVELLLEAGVEPMLKDDEQETALLKAAANAHIDVVRLLMPLADDDERNMAKAFVNAHGKSHAPEYKAPEQSRFAKKVEEVKNKAIDVTARAAKFVGHESPAQRLERVRKSRLNRNKG